MNFMSTVKGSALEGFYPAGWDFDKIDACIDAPEKITERQAHWNKDFTPIKCESLAEFETYNACDVHLMTDVQVRSGFIQQQDLRFLNQTPGKHDPLMLSC